MAGNIFGTVAKKFLKNKKMFRGIDKEKIDQTIKNVEQIESLEKPFKALQECFLPKSIHTTPVFVQIVTKVERISLPGRMKQDKEKQILDFIKQHVLISWKECIENVSPIIQEAAQSLPEEKYLSFIFGIYMITHSPKKKIDKIAGKELGVDKETLLRYMIADMVQYASVQEAKSVAVQNI